MSESRSVGTQLVAVLHSPVFGMAVGIATTIVFYWLTEATIEPVYLASRSAPVSQVSDASRQSNLRGEQLCAAKVAFWNQGSLPLTQDKLTAADPLRVEVSEPVRVTQITTTNASRPTLHFMFDASTLPTKQIGMRIADNDALDSLDGAAFEIRFTGSCKAAFRVNGRVIGTHGIRYRAASTRGFWLWYAAPVTIPVAIVATVVLTFVLLVRTNSALEDLRPFAWLYAPLLWIALALIVSGHPFREPRWRPRFDLNLDSVRRVAADTRTAGRFVRT